MLAEGRLHATDGGEDLPVVEAHLAASRALPSITALRVVTQKARPGAPVRMTIELDAPGCGVSGSAVRDQGLSRSPFTAGSSMMARWRTSTTWADGSTGCTETWTVPTASLRPSLTVSSNTNKAPFAGAVKVTMGADVLLSDTAVPRVCLQEKLIASPSGSLLSEPSSVTLAPAFTT